MQYSGISFTMSPGEKREVEINCGKHVLNAFGPRGLTMLKYGDDEEAVGKDAIDRNHQFQKKQVHEFNVRNEMRRQNGQAWIPPTQKIREYAGILGVELVEPAQPKEKVNDSEIALMRQENRDMKAQMGELMKMLESLTAPKEEKAEEEVIKKKPFGRT